MPENSCEEFADRAAELALGVADGHERAEGLGHVRGCSSCHRDLVQLTEVAENLLLLTPPAEPGAGFETRVIEALRPRPKRFAARRVAVAAVAATVTLGVGLGAWSLGRGSGDRYPGGPLASGVLVASSHEVGRVLVVGGAHPWVSVAVQAAGAGPVTCVVTERDGHQLAVGNFLLSRGWSYWAAPIGQVPSPVSGATLLDSNGATIASAIVR
ncbi:MAG: hypothetical protein ACR2KC_05315 [Acidimicrobiales bacterium]